MVCETIYLKGKFRMLLTCALVLGSLLSTPAVGDVAPDFTVTDTAGNSLTLSKMVEKGPVLLAFFPKAFTGG